MFQPSEFSGSCFRLGPLTSVERCRREIAGCPRPIVPAPKALERCDAYARCDSPSESTKTPRKTVTVEIESGVCQVRAHQPSRSYGPLMRAVCCRKARKQGISSPPRSGHKSGRAAGEQKQGLFWRTIRAAHVVRRRRMHPGMIALEPATLLARRARDNPWFSLRHSLIQIHVIGFIAFRPIPGMPRGGVLPPTPVLAHRSALGSRPRVALSSAQVTSV